MREDFAPFRTPVRGYRFAARPPGAAHPRSRQRVGLLRERDHPRDPLAVAVWTRTNEGTPWRIGYLERAVAARVAPRLDVGQRLRVVIAGWAAEPDGRWRRPVVAIAPLATSSTATPPGR